MPCRMCKATAAPNRVLKDTKAAATSFTTTEDCSALSLCNAYCTENEAFEFVFSADNTV
nr:hypothetical protein Iba_chr11cCG8540 [Ipomoea batatas]